METYRLKRIVIVLLALVNLFLLGLLLNFRWQGSRSRQALSQALAELFAAQGLEECGYRTYLFGAAALHQGRKPTV